MIATAERIWGLLGTERWCSREKCLEQVREFQLQVRRFGSDSRFVGKENDGFVDWEAVFRSSVMGEKLESPVPVDESVLTGKERMFLSKLRAGKEDFKVLVYCDVDGVLVSPAHDWLGSDTLEEPSLAGFIEMGQAADGVIVRSSRFFLAEEGGWRHLVPAFFQTGSLCRFPFMDSAAEVYLKRAVPDRLTLECHKPILGNDREFEGLLALMGDGLDKVIVYSLISSSKDRSKALALLKKWPDVGPSIVFLDTGHFIL